MYSAGFGTVKTLLIHSASIHFICGTTRKAAPLTTE